MIENRFVLIPFLSVAQVISRAIQDKISPSLKQIVKFKTRKSKTQ